MGRHKARLRAELTKVRLNRGFATLEAFRAHIDSKSRSGQLAAETNGSTLGGHPRWIRINTLLTTLKDQLETTFEGYEAQHKLAQISAASPTAKMYYIDVHVPNLIALPPRADLSKKRAYEIGELIIQDKASCFPAYLLDPMPEDEGVVDACAAPGNKTTHLAALLSAKQLPNVDATITNQGPNLKRQRVIAFERDKQRSKTLQKMVALAGANQLVTIRSGQDFLQQDPAQLRHVGALLLDPSCSGSGIVGRDQVEGNLTLPIEEATSQEQDCLRSKKRKRAGNATVASEGRLKDIATSSGYSEQPRVALNAVTATLSQRLKALSAFQIKLLQHAMRYPNARKITYSTCSVHAEENEHVVVRALHSPVARRWRVLKREEQVDGLKRWHVRGQLGVCEDMLKLYAADERADSAATIAEACIRCEKGTQEGTMGFFVAGFIRNDIEATDDGEWHGFSDSDPEDIKQ